MRALLGVLVVVAVLATAAPAYAFCQSCGNDSICYWNPGSGTWCMQHIDYCEEWYGCSGSSNEPQEPAIAAEWTVASVEVETPAGRQLQQVDEVVRTAEAVRVTVE